MVPLTEIYQTSLKMLPLTTFLIGLSGSAHCLGMCGGLVLAATNKTKISNLLYQFGRLSSYLVIGFLTTLLGHFFVTPDSYPTLSAISGILIGILLIYWAIKVYKGSEIKVSLPQKLDQASIHIWRKGLRSKRQNWPNLSSYLIGSLSIFLPCGLLYGVFVALAAFQNPLLSLISIFSFWLGTTPAMLFAPEISKKILSPIANKAPKLSSFLLLFIGIATISNRIYALYFTNSCH